LTWKGDAMPSTLFVAVGGLKLKTPTANQAGFARVLAGKVKQRPMTARQFRRSPDGQKAGWPV